MSGKAQVSRFSELVPHLFSIQPGSAQGLADETNESPCAQVTYYPFELRGIENEHVQQMRNAHKIVVAFHRVPAIGEAVFVVIAATLLHENP